MIPAAAGIIKNLRLTRIGPSGYYTTIVYTKLVSTFVKVST